MYTHMVFNVYLYMKSNFKSLLLEEKICLPNIETFSTEIIWRTFIKSQNRIWGVTNSTPLTEISSSRLVRERMQKDWFVIQLLVYNWFKNPVLFFTVNSGWLGEHRYPATYYVGYKLDRLREARLWQRKDFIWNV